MRLTVSAVAASAFLIALPIDAPAQGFGHILGPIAAPVDSLLRRGARGIRRVVRPPIYRPRIRSIRTPSASRRSIAQRLEHLKRAGQVAQPKPFWPEAPQNIFDYVLMGKPEGLWAHGYGTLVVSMFERPGDTASAAADRGDDRQTTGAASSDEAICNQTEINHADAIAKQLNESLALADDQQQPVSELRAALQRVEKDIRAACPHLEAAPLPERLRIMQDRLWALRVTAINLRAPLQKFQDALTPEQRTKLATKQPAKPDESRENQSDEPAAQCYLLAQVAPQWPAEKVMRILRLNKEQQSEFGVLSKTSSQMGQLMMGSCPKQALSTPSARLDATLDWIDSLLFAAANLAVLVDAFYANLNGEQKERLDKFDL